MEDSIEFISSWLKDGSSHNADILTIFGMGGIGKTSLARHVHGLQYRSFHKSSFVEGVGEKCVAQVNGLLDLQKQLLGDISKTSQIQAHHTSAYKSMIENVLNRKKVFIVLDNIDSVDQLYALLGKQEASLQLLSYHAFMSHRPNEGYEEVAKQVMDYCEGHPLALKVLAESLYNKIVAEWEDCVIGLKEEPNSRIMKALQMSFDSVQSNNDKELFKHIACFFVQKDKVFTETVLNSCGIRTTGIRNLIDRCLLIVGRDNILVMHQLIQEMGRDVVRQESRDKPEERSRLWCHEESFNVLEDNKGTRYIKGLALDMKMLDMDVICGSVELDTSALSKMHNLMLLQLNFVQLNGSYKNFPKKLRWLCMHGFPLKSIPLDLPMENLVALDLSYSNIKSFDISFSNPQPLAKRQKVRNLKHLRSCPKTKSLLGSLKFLTLSFSKKLCKIGGFSELPALQRLIVIKCISLIIICESINQSTELVYIDLSYCQKLKRLPKTIGRLEKVKTLLLDGCDLPELPIKRRDMDLSEVLEAKVVSINSQKSSCATMEVILNDSKFFAISLPISLVRLSLANNNMSDEAFPGDFSCLYMLKNLCLDGNPIVSMPSCVRTLPRIETLGMSNCLKLTSVKHPPRTLRQLNLYNNCWKPDYQSLLRNISFVPEMAALELIADRNLLAPSSFEIEGMIKIQPLVGVDNKLLSNLGWESLEFYKLRCMVTNSSYGGPQESQIQMYYEFGIFSTIYTPGIWIDVLRIWDIMSRKPSMSFTIPSGPNKVRGLNLLYVVRRSSFELPMIKIRNITKNLTWIYKHCIESFSKRGAMYLSFLSHWMFRMNEMEVGDEITINLDKCSEALLLRFQMSFVYDDASVDVGGDEITCTQEKVEKEDPLGYYKSWNHIIGGDLSAFQLTSGEYFLNSMDFLRSLCFNAHYKGRCHF
ncbi:hypothetical protein SSX86_030156 [Deinandra increscens subsp. villosa]|uniref:NB-ARC domain-containing protein n=1 Tax=Deinandra increscens subsp. villosa TaxID=3103831 RepID=A0AAP0CC35_9ASTR